VYCGTIDDVSRDHVVPRCLFIRPYLQNPITVPTCDRCNGEKSLDDAFLRDFLTIDFRGSQNPTAQALFGTKVQRSLRRNSSDLLKSTLPNVRVRSLHTRGGIYIGDFPQGQFDGDRLRRIIAKMVRGLYYDALKERIPEDYHVDVQCHDPWNYYSVLEVFKRLHMNGPRVIGNVFGCAYAKATEDRFVTLWALWFYERVLFTASTDLSSEDSREGA